MNKHTEKRLISLSKKYYNNQDSSHDFNHILRVLQHAEKIAKKERADWDILFPAVLFHDAINYPKNSPKAKLSSIESAELIKKILKTIKNYPAKKIDAVYYAVSVCSFEKNIVPKTLEGKILQDADGLEVTGAISIMRTFFSAGQMNSLLYNVRDPFCKNHKPNPHKYALDLFYRRLLKIQKRCHTKTAKQIAKQRTEFLNKFLHQLKNEI